VGVHSGCAFSVYKKYVLLAKQYEKKKNKKETIKKKKALPAFLDLSGSLPSLMFYFDTFPGPFRVPVFVDLILITFAVTGLALFLGVR
jgi:hypothetical protein